MVATELMGGGTEPDPYDELPYASAAIEWTAPERLALCALLAGGPRAPLQQYRVLELGCGDGANLLPMAFYRPQAQFVGVDGSERAIAAAQVKRRELGIENVRLVRADFAAAEAFVEGPFDFIVVHGVLSWVPPRVRDELLDLCARRLSKSGLLYLNYNTRPGWNIRGMVRDFLLAQTAHVSGGLAARTSAAQEVAANAAAACAEGDHPYLQLMAREYGFVRDSHPSYVAHEFLARDNHAYWRSEFMALLGARGLRYVADADDRYPSGRVSADLVPRLRSLGWSGMPWEDCADLFTFRQLHSPIAAHAGSEQPATRAELVALWLASSLQAQDAQAEGPLVTRRFRHRDGSVVEVRDATVAAVLERLASNWPSARPLCELFEIPERHLEDLILLHRHGMVELRLSDSAGVDHAAALRRCEAAWKGYSTDRYHCTHRFVQPELQGESASERAS